MKLVTAEEMATIDREASAKYGIPSLLLMENAGRAIADFTRRDYPKAERLAVLCGKGNNAGDGFVAARHLASDHLVTVFLSAQPESLQGDAATNYALLKAYPVETRRVQAENLEKELVRIRHADLLIDAIFGTGLQGTLSAYHRQWIKGINESGVPILAVDIPSGLDANTGHTLGEAVRAQSTLTMGLPKRGLYAPAAAEWVDGSRSLTCPILLPYCRTIAGKEPSWSRLCSMAGCRDESGIHIRAPMEPCSSLPVPCATVAQPIWPA